MNLISHIEHQDEHTVKVITFGFAKNKTGTYDKYDNTVYCKPAELRRAQTWAHQTFRDTEIREGVVFE